MAKLGGKTLFITGGSRGIGLAIALRAARDGANVAVAAKTIAPHPKLPGTIYSAVEEISAAGGNGLALACDVRSEDQIKSAVERTAAHFGGIDVLINNASAISLSGTRETPAKKFDLMMQVNVRATFLCSQHCLPHLLKSDNPHILTLAPPLNLDRKWLGAHVAYTLSKYGMSLCTLGLAEEFREKEISINSLWPRTLIATAALGLIRGVDPERCRDPSIVADAAYLILTRPRGEVTGQALIDDEVLAAAGVTDLSGYAKRAESELHLDLFIDER